jgi:glycosyltransferase involved in cell wall biosynthesis
MSRQLPVQATNSSWKYLLDFSTVLVAQRFDVHFLSPSSAALVSKPVSLLQSEISVFKTFRVRGSWRIGKWMISKDFGHLFYRGLAACREILFNRGLSANPKLRQAPPSIATALTREEQVFIAEHVPQRADYLVADDCFLTDALPYALRPDAPSAVIVHDLISSQASQLLGSAAKAPPILTEDDEIAKLAQATCIVVQHKDQIARINRRLPDRRIIVAPIVATPRLSPQPGDSDLILFVGDRTESNIDGLQWFLATCWPLIRKDRPHTQFWVAGTVSQTFAPPPAAVRFLGFVEDLASLYRETGVVISPLRIGSLPEDKLIEALEHGKAVVTTPAALPSGAHIFTDAMRIAEEPTDFASAIVSLLDDEALRIGLGMKGLGILFQHFSAKSCYAPLVDVFRSPELEQGALRDATSAVDISDKNGQSAVTVCICTFRRTTIASTLYSVANQLLPADIKCQIIVVDNDFERTAESLISAFRVRTKIPVEYVHAPGQNISIARNAGLDVCKTRWLAFLDDDEIASVNWLDRLMALREHASAVFGPSEAVYNPKGPKWIRQADLHSNRLVWRRGLVETGYTSTVLMDMDFVHKHQLRFNEELGRSGGEDTMFFAAMRQSGGRLAYAREAIAYEYVSDARTTLNWVVKRRFRVGQVTAMMRRVYDLREYQLLPLIAPLKISYCVAAAVLLAARPGRAMWWLMRAVFHCGSLSYRLTGRVRQEYSFFEPR